MARPNPEGVHCGQCGAALGEPPNTPPDARVPCPSCGSTTRTITVHVTEGVRASEHISALQERRGEAIGFSESERQGRASSATLRDEGTLDMTLVGSSPQGEEDTPAACQVLKERLNADGGHWDRIIPGREPADCVLVDAQEPGTTLEVQVVHAVASQDLWRRLNSAGSVQGSLSPVEAATEIRLAMETKARDMKIPRQLRGDASARTRRDSTPGTRV